MNKSWRIVATGFSFLMFGIGGILIPLFAIPILYILPGSELQRERRAKAIIHYAFRAFVELMRIVGVLNYTVPNADELNRPGRLILANHPSLIDVVFLIAFIKSADCVVKGSLQENIFTRGAIGVANYIVNKDPEKVIQLAAKSLQRGNSLIIFPEGTRTTPKQAITMQRGAANIALRSGRNITPIVIRCTPTTLTKDLKWYQVPERKVHFSMILQADIDIKPFQNETRNSLASRNLTKFLEHYFTQELRKHD